MSGLFGIDFRVSLVRGVKPYRRLITFSRGAAPPRCCTAPFQGWVERRLGFLRGAAPPRCYTAPLQGLVGRRLVFYERFLGLAGILGLSRGAAPPRYYTAPLQGLVERHWFFCEGLHRHAVILRPFRAWLGGDWAFARGCTASLLYCALSGLG